MLLIMMIPNTGYMVLSSAEDKVPILMWGTFLACISFGIEYTPQVPKFDVAFYASCILVPAALAHFPAYVTDCAITLAFLSVVVFSFKSFVSNENAKMDTLVKRVPRISWFALVIGALYVRKLEKSSATLLASLIAVYAKYAPDAVAFSGAGMVGIIFKWIYRFFRLFASEEKKNACKLNAMNIAQIISALVVLAWLLFVLHEISAAAFKIENGNASMLQLGIALAASVPLYPALYYVLVDGQNEQKVRKEKEQEQPEKPEAAPINVIHAIAETPIHVPASPLPSLSKATPEKFAACKNNAQEVCKMLLNSSAFVKIDMKILSTIEEKEDDKMSIDPTEKNTGIKRKADTDPGEDEASKRVCV